MKNIKLRIVYLILGAALLLFALFMLAVNLIIPAHFVREAKKALISEAQYQNRTIPYTDDESFFDDEWDDAEEHFLTPSIVFLELDIYDWNYWWGYYRCGKDWNPFDAAEFSLSEDEAGETPFFHFDFHNLSALHQTTRDGEFVEPDNPDHPYFLEQARRLRSGEQDWFVGALYYPLFSQEMHFCNASVRSGVPLTQLLSPSVPPYYGVIFLREERPLTPEVLTHWAETLSQPLFGQPFSCTLAQVPSRQEAMERLENETRLTR